MQWTGLASALSIVAARLEAGVKAELLPLMSLQPFLAKGFKVPVSMLRGGESSGTGTLALDEELAASGSSIQSVQCKLPHLSVRR